MTGLKPFEYKLISRLLKEASEKFSNHGCNDIPESWFRGVSFEDRNELARLMEIDNGTPEDWNETSDASKSADWWLMLYYSAKCKEIAEEGA